MDSESTHTTTAVEGGHVTDIEATNRVIREIVEARNSLAFSDPETVEEIQYEVQSMGDLVSHPTEVYDSAASPPAMPNPKDVAGSRKLPLSLWPAIATAEGSLALLNGACKYGQANWRRVPIRLSVYLDAIMRHVTAVAEGGWRDEEGVTHLGSALASLAIVLDAEAAGTLIDDRSVAGGYADRVPSLTAEVGRIKALHAAKHPRHYTMQTEARDVAE